MIMIMIMIMGIIIKIIVRLGRSVIKCNRVLIE